MADAFPVISDTQVVAMMAIAEAAGVASPIPDWHMIDGSELGLGGSLSNGLFTNAHGQAVVASAELDGRLTLAIGFRGSNDDADWEDDFQNINRHYDLFTEFVAAVKTAIQSGLYDQILVSGHSLGGAMTQMFMEDYDGIAPAYAITTGSPGFLQPEATADGRIINYQIADDPIIVLGNNRASAGMFLSYSPSFGTMITDALELSADLLTESLPYMTENYYGRGSNVVLSVVGHPDTAPSLRDLLGSLDPTAHDFELYLSNIGQVDADPFDLTAGSRGGAGNDALFGTTGNDVVDGGAGLDTLYLHVNRAGLSILNTGEGLTVTSAGSGTDTLTGVERLNLADGGLAFDFDGSAGHTARLIGAVFGSEYLDDRVFVGIGLELFDGGMTMEQVAQLALGTDLFRSLAGSTSNADFVSFVYENVVGMAPSAGEHADFVGLLDSGVFTQASLAALAAETDLNEVNIDLVGLIQAGIDFA